MRRFIFKKGICLYIFLLGSCIHSPAQLNNIPIPDSLIPGTTLSGNFCSTDMMLNGLRKDAAYREREKIMNQEIRVASRNLLDTIITLPVVVHIINTNPAGITDAFVINGINDLNDAFGKTGAYSASLGADTRIRFCFAKKDPDGGISTGITRTKSYFSNNENMDIEDRRLKNLIQWDPSHYINIWLVSSINGEAYAFFSCGIWYRAGVSGYATFPPGGGPTDGIVISGFGKLLAHEMGHYLGLYHTFEGGCYNFDCATNGDQVCDTPPDNSLFASFSCAFPGNSCNTDTLSAHSNGNFFTDVPDQIDNFMDYSNNACSNRFTDGQSKRMRAAIITQRAGLLVDECSAPCPESINASFINDNPYPLPGDNINFTNQSTGAANYQWSVDGVVVGTSTDLSYTFPSIGKYKINLKAYNTITCYASYSAFVIVSCGVTARFYTDKKRIASNAIYPDSIRFTNNSYNSLTYKWLVSNDQGMAEHVETINTDMIYTFLTPGNYRVRLIATNGSCSDTTETYFVPVADPNPDGVPYAITLQCYQPNHIRVNFCLANFGYASLPTNSLVNFYDGPPGLSTTHRISPTFTLPLPVPGGNCARCFSQILDVDYHGINQVYLVFNDAGTAIPVVLPNTTLVETIYYNNIGASLINAATVVTAICQGQNYAGHTTTGTFVDVYSGINGCDSTRTLQLTVKPVFTTTITSSICQGQNYAGHTTTGTFVDVYTAGNGCDSTRTLNLTVKPTFTTSVNASICQGQNYAGHTTTGTFVDVYTAQNGCDSTRTLNLIVKPTFSTNINSSICQGENYAGHSSTGTYTDVYTAVNGCDSIRTLNLTVNPVLNTNIVTSICQGQNYAGHTTSGIYTDVYTSSYNCDSIRRLDLTVKPVYITSVTTSICQGDNYAGHTTSGTYVDLYTATNGCDSTRTLNLTVKPLSGSNIQATICEGLNYAGHTVTGNYIDIYTGINGCDSTRALQLTVDPRQYTFLNREICFGESYFVAGNFQTSPGIYRDTLRTYQGCDSVIATDLTVHPLPIPSLGPDRGICLGDTLHLNPGSFESYLWQDGSSNPDFSTTLIGSYAVTVTNIFNCKATDIMNLTEIYPLPSHFLPPDTVLCAGNTLNIRVRGYKSYTWTTGSTNYFIDVTQTGMYGLLAHDWRNCPGIDSMQVQFNKCILIQIPNAFTPNNDGINDVFKPLIPAPVNDYHMQIRNRWGELLFETQNYQSGWDGTFKKVGQPIAVYVYLITLRDENGNKILKKGTLALIR